MVSGQLKSGARLLVAAPFFLSLTAEPVAAVIYFSQF
jgi:hypothetical protein